MKLFTVYDTRNECQGTYTNQATADAKRVELNESDSESHNCATVLEIDSDPTLERETALAAHLGCSLESVSECSYGDNQYESEDEPGEYLVLTDSEADDLWEKSLENYIDDCILSGCKDETIKRYFDREAWKQDARHDGRAHGINPYDGSEDCETVDGTTYYIYRVN